MTPAEFASAYRATADRVSIGTKIDPIALLTQWANETDWGVSWAGAPFNLGNIENNGRVILYTSLDSFVQACIDTYHLPTYAGVLAAANTIDQLAAIVASPWSAGHYGGSLMGFYSQLEAFELTPDEHYYLVDNNNHILNVIIPTLNALSKAVSAIGTQGGSLTPAQAQELADSLATAQAAKAELDTIKAQLGKDLAP